MEATVANDEARNSHTGSHPGAGQAGSATPRVSIAVDDTRKTRTLSVKAAVDNLSFYYGQHRALKNLTIQIAERQVTALIGPSGCGKSTFLRCFNRMHDLQPDTRYEGSITTSSLGS